MAALRLSAGNLRGDSKLITSYVNREYKRFALPLPFHGLSPLSTIFPQTVRVFARPNVQSTTLGPGGVARSHILSIAPG